MFYSNASFAILHTLLAGLEGHLLQIKVLLQS
jgi:hypothetical protein